MLGGGGVVSLGGGPIDILCFDQLSRILSMVALLTVPTVASSTALMSFAFMLSISRVHCHQWKGENLSDNFIQLSLSTSAFMYESRRESTREGPPCLPAPRRILCL